MDLAARKYNFIQELSSIDENLLEKLELFLNTRYVLIKYVRQ